MQKKDNELKSNLIIGTIFITISIILGWIYYYDSNVLFLLLAVFVLLVSISIITRPIKHLLIIKYFNIGFSWIIGSIYLIATLLMSVLLVLMSIYITWALLIVVIKFLIWNFGFTESIKVNYDENNQVLFYCSSLLTVLLVSYQGNNLVIWLNKLFSISTRNKESVEMTEGLAITLLNHLDIRRRCYEISIGLYVFSVIETLTITNLLDFSFWLTYKTVALEVMLSFVAIDTYLRNYPNKKNKTSNR